MHPIKDISVEQMSALRSPYMCIKCGEGVMIPATEGEADDTENLLCVQCHFYDSIPTTAIISGQILTSAIGLAICFYLFFNHVLASFDDNAAVQGFTMSMIVAGFTVGFIYVLGKALNGIKHRSAYIPNQRANT